MPGSGDHHPLASPSQTHGRGTVQREHIRIYNGPKPSKKCSACEAVITVGDKYWRGLEGVTRACLPCGSRIRGERTYAAARLEQQQNVAEVADRQQHRQDRRAAILRGDTLA